MKKHIYLHYPYCLYKCHYCDFNSYSWEKSDIPQSRYTEALLSEIKQRQQLFEIQGTHFYEPQSEIESVFFGGGTPSLMDPKDVSRLLDSLQTHFKFEKGVEVTLECNPGTVTLAKLRAFKDAGVNRLSIGVQSLNENNLKKFGRIHDGAEALRAIDTALESGIPRVSADLIFGFPDQTLAGWQSDLEEILKKGLSHLSCYALTAEPDTIYTKALHNGDYLENDSEIFADMLQYTYERMQQAGLEAYEISNFAKRGEESQHNLGYWRYDSYLGLGAGAWSNFFKEGEGKLPSRENLWVMRTKNTRSPEPYMRAASTNSFFELEEIDRETAMGEFMMMGLRLREGVSKVEFKLRFKIDLETVYCATLKQAQNEGWLTNSGDRIFPTQKAFMFNNTLSLMFMK